MPARHGTRLGTLVLLLFASTADSAIYRCTDDHGLTTFSDNTCDAGSTSQTVALPAINRLPPPPRHSEAQSPSAEPRKSRRQTAASADTAGDGGIRLIETGNRDDGCGNALDERARRRAVVEGRIYSGMPQAAVERALGRPDRVTRTDSRLRYHYLDGNGRPAQVISFDEMGCVSSKQGRKTR